jgi:hypothetical protein
MNNQQANTLPYRQIHLDFHTSPYIENIGSDFDKKQWQETLKLGHVNSITLFAACHHGWSYFDTKVGEMHPHLGFDLLRAQFDATKEIGVNAPIYITAGVNNWASYNHPEWREVDAQGRYIGWVQNSVDAGFHTMCFNTPYIDLLCKQIEEVAKEFPDADGIFLDIINQSECCCRWCLDGMDAAGMDFTLEVDRKAWKKHVLLEYYKKTTASAKANDPEMKVFHNSGHIDVGGREILPYFSHLELESLPTGGWGYDHFPMSAAYVRGLGKDFLGMTGKFHTTWGEFGGYKHPNALRYECAAMIAFGSKCSVGDQLDPRGKLDTSTYKIIGEAFADVEQKEPWCEGVEFIADIAILAAASTHEEEVRDQFSDYGAGRVFLEEQILFDVIDCESNFSVYSALVLPDELVVDHELSLKLNSFTENGGKLILAGNSALRSDKQGFFFETSAEYFGVHESDPDYLVANDEYQPEFTTSAMVMYGSAQKIKVEEAKSLGRVYPSYFNKKGRKFCSHQHAPVNLEGESFDAGFMDESILYFGHPVFSMYRIYGQVALRQYISKAVRTFLGDNICIKSNLPSQARVSFTKQKNENRYVLHLLFANKLFRGGRMNIGGTVSGGLDGVEIIEELVPLHETEIDLKIPEEVSSVTLEPSGEQIKFEQTNGGISFVVDKFSCHQMVAIHV